MSVSVPELDVFVADPTFLNPSVFSLWLQGDTVEQAIQNRLSLEGNVFATPSVVASDTMDQYQLFNMLEHFFHNPKYLSSQLIVPLAPQLQQMILERYYSFDDAVVRELLGKKLSARVRKDLDDVSEKARVSLQNCRRQFDNLKRIFKAVEDTQNGLEETIQTMFLFSTETSKKYARIVFLCSNRFETNKKKLSFLTFSDFMYFAAVLMSEWTVKGAPPGEDLDPVFLQDLRDLKMCFANDREVLAEQRSIVKAMMVAAQSPPSEGVSSSTANNYSSSTVGLGPTPLPPVSGAAWPKLSPEEREQVFDKKIFPVFKSIIRNLLSIGSGLSQSKELRDMFIDILEKVVEPCRDEDWTLTEMEHFFTAVLRSFDQVESIGKALRARYSPVFQRYIRAAMLCACKMLKRLQN